MFDPEKIKDVNTKKSMEDDSDSDEGAIFRSKALSASNATGGVAMVRTRSQTKSRGDLTGKIVFAHKGKAIPCWFPGKIGKKTNKGYMVDFFNQFEAHDCAEKNILLYDEFFLKKNEKSALFKVPSKLKTSFENALSLAKEATQK